MNRPPIGIAILGFLALVEGIAAAFQGLTIIGAVTFGPVSTGNGVLWTGALALILGLLYIALAYAAWSLRLWAWAYGMFIGVLGLFNAFLIMLSSNNIGEGFAAALLPTLLLWYLNTPSVRYAFLDTATDGYTTDYDRAQAQRITAERSNL
jgi:hypothetical protein